MLGPSLGHPFSVMMSVVSSSLVWSARSWGPLPRVSVVTRSGPGSERGEEALRGWHRHWASWLVAPRPAHSISPCLSCFSALPPWLMLTIRNSLLAACDNPFVVRGALVHLWRPETADGCDVSCPPTWQQIFSFHSEVVCAHSLSYPIHIAPHPGCSLPFSEKPGPVSFTCTRST